MEKKKLVFSWRIYPSQDSLVDSILAWYRGGPRFKYRQGREFFLENKWLNYANLNGDCVEFICSIKSALWYFVDVLPGTMLSLGLINDWYTGVEAVRESCSQKVFFLMLVLQGGHLFDPLLWSIFQFRCYTCYKFPSESSPWTCKNLKKL